MRRATRSRWTAPAEQRPRLLAIVTAVAEYGPRDTWLTDANNRSSWQRERVKTAAYLILASPQYQIQR